MKKEILKIIFFNFFFIIIFIFIAESILRILNLSQIQGYKVELLDKSLHKIRKNTEGVVLGEKVYVDQNGYRIPFKEFTYSGKEKILFLGDSVTFGVGVKEEDSFVGIFRENFKIKKIYNLSLFGYQVSHISEQLNEIENLLPVKKIIYFVTLNDVYDDSNVLIGKIEENMQSGKIKKLLNNEVLIKINVFLREKSFLFTFLKGVVLDPSKSWFQNVLNYYKQNELENMRSFLLKFEEFSESNDIKYHIFLLPYEYQTRDCNKKILYPQTKLRELTSNIGNNLIDLTKNFCEYNDPKKLFLKYDPMHLSREGHKFVYDLTKNKIFEDE